MKSLIYYHGIFPKWPSQMLRDRKTKVEPAKTGTSSPRVSSMAIGNERGPGNYPRPKGGGGGAGEAQHRARMTRG